MMKTRLVALVPAAALIVSLGACSSSSSKAKETTTVEATTTTTAPADASTTTADGGSTTTAAPAASELSKSVTDHLGSVHGQTDVTVTGDETAGIKIVYGATISAADAGSICGNAAMVAGATAAITVEAADGTKAASRPAGGACS